MVMDYNFLDSAIRWQISKSMKTIMQFSLALAINGMLTFEIFDLEK